jgi:hypothetical protein
VREPYPDEMNAGYAGIENTRSLGPTRSLIKARTRLRTLGMTNLIGQQTAKDTKEQIAKKQRINRNGREGRKESWQNDSKPIP